VDTIWNVITGILWQVDATVQNLGNPVPFPVQISLEVIAWGLAVWAFWKMGGGDQKQIFNAMIATTIIAGVAFMLGASQPLLAWLFAVPVCALALLAGRSDAALVRWQARLAWIVAALASGWGLDNGPVVALVVSLCAWTVGWASRRMPLHYRSWARPPKPSTKAGTSS